MTNRTLAAVGIAALALAAGATVATVATDDSSTPTAITTVSPIGAPVIHAVVAKETQIELDYGPSQPGPFAASNARARSLRISWPPAKDTKHPTGLTYTVQKNGKTINAGLVNNYITVGFTTAVRTFRICVKTVNSVGYNSPYGCTTFTGS